MKTTFSAGMATFKSAGQRNDKSTTYRPRSLSYLGRRQNNGMCGIAGIVYRDRSTIVDQELLWRMTNVLEHRGPDAYDFHNVPGFGLGHRRLSIIDPAAGHQPMTDPDSKNVIIYNGEVYN